LTVISSDSTIDAQPTPPDARGHLRDPVSATVVWSDVERLLHHLGASIRERSGSRIFVRLNGCVSDFHRPHRRKEARQYQIRDVRDLLIRAGVLPWE
jgi:HicA toxin of bacterial toxin-antitoxin,